MINFRASQLAAALSVWILIGLPAAEAAGPSTSPTLAQNEAPTPRRLLPRKELAPEPDSAPPAPQESPAPAEVRSGIQINPLEGPDPQDFGTIEAASGGLARTMWAGTSAATAAHLIGQLPKAVVSPTARDLIRRAMLTAAVPPAQNRAGDVVGLAALRVGQLQAMGLLGSASELLQAAPEREKDAGLRRLQIENFLIRGELRAVCDETRRPGIDLTDRYWQHVLIFCQILEDNLDEASFGASLLAESGEPVDPLFMALIDGFVSGQMPTVDTVEKPTPLLLSMLRHGGVPFPESLVDTASPPLLAMIANGTETDLDLRFAAAEAAVRFGAMTRDRLIRIYADAPFSGEDLDSALSTAEAARSPRGRALLYQAASGHTVPTARAEVLQRALDFAAEDGVYPLSIALFGPMIEAMPSSVELSWFAADAARALSALGRIDLARPWINGLRYQSVRDPAARQSLHALWALTTLTTPPETAGPAVGSLGQWREAVMAADADVAGAKIKRGLALLEIDGHPVSNEDWIGALGTFQAAQATVPDFGYRAALTRAAEANRVAETVLLAAIITGRNGAGALDPGILREVTNALRSVGLSAEAHAIVFEAAVEKGI